MSQEKVDYNKEQKRNRKQIVKKQRRQKALRITLTTIAAVLLVTWVGYSVYTKKQAKDAETTNYLTIDSSALSDYLSNLSE